MLLDLVWLQEPYIYEIAISDNYTDPNNHISYGKLIGIFNDVYCMVNFKFGKFHGVRKTYNNNGKMIKRYTYKRGFLHGRCYNADRPEYIMSGKYVNGLMSGLWKYKYYSGEVCTTEYVGGRIHGQVKHYYSSGVLHIGGRQIDHNRVGKWCYCDHDGHENKTEFYTAGNLVRRVIYYANGCKKINTKYNKRSVTKIEYDINGHEINRQTSPHGIFPWI